MSFRIKITYISPKRGHTVVAGEKTCTCIHICIKFITINKIRNIHNMAATHYFVCVCSSFSYLTNKVNYTFVEKLSSTRRTFDLPHRFSLLHVLVCEKASLKHHLIHARSCSLPFCTCDVERARIYESPKNIPGHDVGLHS